MGDENKPAWIMPIDRSDNKNGAVRDLIFTNLPSGTKKMTLRFQDSQFSEYVIPLGTQDTVPDDEDIVDADTILIPMVPVRYTLYDVDIKKMRKSTAPLEPGWLYVYRDGYLWRELEVYTRGKMRDVNLTEYQGFDKRPATGESDNRVILPHKINNEIPEIQVCYSQTQWSWARINALGGMAEDDPRVVIESLEMPSGEQPANASKLRSERMGPAIDLSNYKEKFEIESGPMGIANESSCSIARLQRKQVIPLLYLHDPLTITHGYAQEYLVEFEKLKAYVHLAQQHTHYKSAVLAYQTFFNTEITKSPVVTSYGMISDYEDVTALTEPRDKLDKDFIEEILFVKKRQDIRTKLRKLKEKYVTWLQGKVAVSKIIPATLVQPAKIETELKDIKEIIRDGEWFIDFNTAITDYFTADNDHYVSGFSAFIGATSFLSTDCSVIDQELNLPDGDKGKPYQGIDSGYEYLSSIMKPSHILYSKLFPKKADFDPYNENTESYVLADETNDGTGVFRNAAFALVYNSNQKTEFVSQGTRRVMQTGKAIVTDLMHVFKKQWENADEVKKVLIEEINVSLTKATGDPGDPLIKGIHIVKKNASLEGKIIIDGKARVIKSLTNAKKNLITGATHVKGSKSIKIYDLLPDGPGKNKMISLTDIAIHELHDFKGFNSPITEQRWQNIFIKSSSKFELNARANYVVVPDTNPMAVYHHNPSAQVSESTKLKVKAINKAKYVLPPVVVFFEVFNVQQAYKSLVESKDKVKSSFNLFDAAGGLAHSTLEATEILAGGAKNAQALMENVFMKLADKTGKRSIARIGEIAADYAFKKKITLFGQSVRLLNVFGAAFAGLSAVLSLWDMAIAIRRGDTAAAVGNAMMAAGFTVLTFTGLSILGPWGWAAMAVVTIGVLVVQWYKDTPLEKWAKFGPLRKLSASEQIRNDENPAVKEYYSNDRATEEFDNHSSEQVYDALRDLLCSPSIRFTSEAGNTYVETGTGGEYIKDVVAIINLPLYETNKSNVDVRVTKQQDNIGPDVLLGLSKQEIAQPYKIVQVRDPKSNNITQMKYYFKPQGKQRGQQDYYWQAKGRIFTAEQRRIPSIPPKTPANKINESNKIDQSALGWVYAET